MRRSLLAYPGTIVRSGAIVFGAQGRWFLARETHDLSPADLISTQSIRLFKFGDSSTRLTRRPIERLADLRLPQHAAFVFKCGKYPPGVGHVILLVAFCVCCIVDGRRQFDKRSREEIVDKGWRIEICAWTIEHCYRYDATR